MAFDFRQEQRSLSKLRNDRQTEAYNSGLSAALRRCAVCGLIVLCLSSLSLVLMPQKLAMAQDASALDAALEEVWTTQERHALSGPQKHSWAKHFELALNLGIIPNDSYANYFPISVDVTYHFTEQWALSLRAAITMAHSKTTLARFIAKHQPDLDIHRLNDEQLGHFDLYASYYPVYGKWSAGQFNLGHFSWGLMAGLGLVLSKEAKDMDAKIQISPYFEGLVGTQVQLHILSWLALRIEASLRIYQNAQGFRLPATVSLGLSFTLPNQVN